MAKRQIPVLREIKNKEAWNQETEREFSLLLQKALVLALKERKLLDDCQYARLEGHWTLAEGGAR